MCRKIEWGWDGDPEQVEDPGGSGRAAERDASQVGESPGHPALASKVCGPQKGP